MILPDNTNRWLYYQQRCSLLKLLLDGWSSLMVPVFPSLKSSYREENSCSFSMKFDCYRWNAFAKKIGLERLGSRQSRTHPNQQVLSTAGRPMHQTTGRGVMTNSKNTSSFCSLCHLVFCVSLCLFVYE